MINRIFFLLLLICAASTSLWAQDFSQPSKIELYQRAREAMLDALKKGNLERAAQALDYLKENAANGAPLTEQEEFLADFEIGRFEDGVVLYADLHRNLLDSSYVRESPNRKNIEDRLSQYLLRGENLDKRMVDSLCARVDSSDIKQMNKLLYKTLLHFDYFVLRSVIANTMNSSFVFDFQLDKSSAEEFLGLAKAFVENYPFSEHASYLKDVVIPPLQELVDKRNQFAKDPLAYKYYTGGFGFYLYTALGFMAGEAADYLNYETGSPFMFGFDFRVKRVSLNVFLQFGFISHYNFNKCDVKTRRNDGIDVFGDKENWTFGSNVGFVAYDSRYLRVEPFVGFSSMFYEHLENTTLVPEFMLGSNVDFRFYTSPQTSAEDNVWAFSLRLKYMMHLGSLKENCCNDGKKFSAVRHTFGLGLGVELW